MVDAVKTDVKLSIKVGKKTYFTSNNINLLADNDSLYEVAEAISMAQDDLYERIMKQETFRLI